MTATKPIQALATKFCIKLPLELSLQEIAGIRFLLNSPDHSQYDRAYIEGVGERHNVAIPYSFASKCFILGIGDHDPMCQLLENEKERVRLSDDDEARLKKWWQGGGSLR